MNEQLLRIMAEVIGEEVLCLLVDYVDANRKDRHMPFHAMGGNEDIVVNQILDIMKKEGNRVTGITQYKGFHTSTQLLEYAANGTKIPFSFLYFNPAALSGDTMEVEQM